MSQPTENRFLAERVEVPYAAHSIPVWTVEEKCACGEPAAHKIEETSGPQHFHSLSAYLCCRCFSQTVGICDSYPYEDEPLWR